MVMRTIVVLCLVVMIALSFGCSKKKEAPQKPQTSSMERKAHPKIGDVDPVSNVEATWDSPYAYEYNGVLYNFESAENMEAFKADPEKYLKKLQEKEAAPPESK